MRAVQRAVLIVVLLILLTSTIAVAVALTVTPKGIAGSDKVAVSCPANPCSATVDWVLDGAYDVSGCEIGWSSADNKKTYTVYCIVYDSGGNSLASGSASANNGPTTVDLSQAVDPSQIYYVEVIIVEE